MKSAILIIPAALCPAAEAVATANALGSAGRTPVPCWRDDVVAQLQGYCGERDGWKGAGGLAPSAVTVSHAIRLADQFKREMPNLPRPMVSGDDDGSVCFFWNDGAMIAAVSVFSDGTYAYYAEADHGSARSDRDVIGHPLKAGLVDILTISPVTLVP